MALKLKSAHATIWLVLKIVWFRNGANGVLAPKPVTVEVNSVLAWLSDALHLAVEDALHLRIIGLATPDRVVQAGLAM